MTISELIKFLEKFPASNKLHVETFNNGLGSYEHQEILSVASFSADHPSGEDGCPVVIELGEVVASGWIEEPTLIRQDSQPMLHNLVTAYNHFRPLTSPPVPLPELQQYNLTTNQIARLIAGYLYDGLTYDNWSDHDWLFESSEASE